ncbi:MAG TPA: MMPL family transporter, partial [Candidatus Corynebacterium intestinavium]|nr:MMPL family transporter [Candidatus Corynebacterium intestinavium]
MNSSSARRFRWLALALIAISGALLSLGSIAVPDSQTATLPDGFDSTRVAAEREAASDHQGGATATALVLFTGDIGANRAAL